MIACVFVVVLRLLTAKTRNRKASNLLRDDERDAIVASEELVGFVVAGESLGPGLHGQECAHCGFLVANLPVPTHANPSPHDPDFALPAASDIIQAPDKLTDQPKEERCEDLSPHYWR